MIFQSVDQLGVERGDIGRCAECAVIEVTPRTPCDLAEFARQKITEADAIEFSRACESDMVEIEIEAHANGVGRHEEIHIARLIQLDLRVACARAERAEHDGSSAPLAADQFGDRIDIIGGKSDDG